MLLRTFFCFLVSFHFVSLDLIDASQSATLFASQADGNDKALKYHKALRKRPSTGYLYDRFYDTWLETSSIKNLEKFLSEQAKTTGETGDKLLLAFFFSKGGDDVRALQQFRDALKNEPGNAIIWYEKALVEARTLDFETALSDLKKASEANPKKEIGNKIAQLRGKLYVRNRQNSEAIDVWKRLIAENPDDFYLIEDVIELQIDEGLYEEAAKLSDQLIAKTKDPYQKVMRELRKGDIVQRSGKRDNALAIYGKTLGQVGNDSWLEREILGQIENLFRREDDLIGLKQHYKKMIAANDKRLAIRKAVAKLNVELGSLDEAIEDYKKIVELTPGDRSNRETLIDILARAEKMDLAIKQTESLIKQFSEDAEIRLKLARLHFESKAKNKQDNIVQAIDQFIDASGKTEYAFLRAARMLERFKVQEQAAKTFEACIEKFPESQTSRESFADHLYKNGQKPRAIEIWNGLAKNADRANAIRIARQLGTRQEHQAAFDLLIERFEEFKLHSAYLGQLCTEAMFLKKTEQAIPWSLERIRLAHNALDLDNCIGQAVQVISKSEKVLPVIKQLKAEADRNVSTTCLLSELMEINLNGSEAEQLLVTALQAIEKDSQLESKRKAEYQQMLASQRVRLLMTRRDWTSAATAAQKRIELPGGRKTNNIRQLIELLIRDGQLEKAQTWIAEWKKISPGSIVPWFNESAILSRLGKPEESIAVLRQAAQKFPEDADLHMSLGELYLDNAQYKDAQRIYWRQFEDSKSLSDKLRWTEKLANVAEQVGELDQLVRKIQERRKNNPNSVEPLLALAQVHRVADNYEERRKALLEATRVQKENLPLLMEIARLEESEGDWEKAIKTLEGARELDKSGRVKERIATLYMQYGETERGYGMLLELAGGIQSGPRDIEKITDAIIKSGDWQMSKDFLQEQISRFPKDYRLQYLMAVINEELELYNEARDSFVALLNGQEEIQGLKSSSVSRRAQWNMVNSLLPPEAIEVLKVSESQHYSYSHQQTQTYFASSGSSLPTSKIYLPESAEQVRYFSLTHLTRIASEQNEEERSDLVQTLSSAGIGYANLIFSMDQNLSNIFGGEFTLLDDFPDNPTVLALAIYSNMYEDTLEPKSAAKAYDLFNKKHPELGLLAALLAAANDEEYHSLLDAILERNDEFTPSYVTIAMVSRYLSEQSPGREIKLSKQQIATLNKKLLEWYPKLSSNSQYSSWMFSMIAGSLKKSPDPTPFIKFLEDEIDRYTSGQQKQPRFNYYGYGRGNSDQLIKFIDFPPKTFVSFPDGVVNLLGYQNGYLDPFGNGEVEDPETWKAKFEAAVESATNPMLKLLLKIQLIEIDPESLDKTETEKYADVQKELDQYLLAEKPNADHYLLAAGLASKIEQWQKASDLLEKLRNMPLSKEMRQQIDSGLVALATEGISADFEKPENSKILSSAKSAALRLRRGRLPANERVQLLSAMETLGLTKEAEKMENQIARMPAAASSSSGSVYYNSGSTSRTSTKKIRELMDSGKSDSAMRLLVSEFKSQTQNSLNIDYLYYDQYELREFIKRMNSLNITENLIDKLKPGSSTSSSKLGAYAVALEIFDRKEEAIEVYKKILATRKKQDGARLRLMLLELESGQDYSRHFAQFSDAARTKLSQVIQQRSNDNENGLRAEQIFEFCKSLHKYADEIELKKDNGVWLVSFTQWLSTNFDAGGNLYLPSLYSTNNSNDSVYQPRNKKSKERFRKLLDQRKRAHDELCESMFKIPALKKQAFTSLLRSAEADVVKTSSEKTNRDPKTVDDLSSFVPKAIQALIEFKTNKRSPNNNLATSYFSYNRFGQTNKSVPSRSPLEFLARHFGLQSEAKRKDSLQKVYDELVAGEKVKEVERLKDLIELYSSSNDQFEALANQFIENESRKNKRMALPATETALEKLVEIWKDTRSELDLDSFILSYAKKKTSSRSSGPSYKNYLKDYLTILAQQKQVSRVDDILDQYSISVLGPRETQKKLFKDYNSNNRRSGLTRTNAGVSTYLQFLRAMNQKELILPAMRQARKAGIGDHVLTLGHYLSQHITSFEDASELVEWLSTTPFLNDLETFDPYVDHANTTSTVYGNTIEQLIYQECKCLKKLEKMFGEKASLTFGEEILLISARSGGDKKGVGTLLNVLGSRVEEFKALPLEQQKRIALFASQIVTSENFSYASRSTNITDSGKAADALIVEILGDTNAGEIEKLKKAKRIADLNIDAYRFDQYAQSLLGRINRNQPTQWIEVFTKTVELMKKDKSRYFGYSGASIAGNLFSEIVNNRFDYQWLAVLHDIHQNNGEIDFLLSNDNIDQIGGFFNKQVQSLSKNEKNKSNVQKLDALYRQLGAQMEGRDTTLFIPFFYRLLNYQAYKKSHDKLMEWAKGESESGKYKELAFDFVLALEIHKTHAEHVKSSKDKIAERPIKPAEYQQKLLDLVNDESISLRSKLFIVSQWINFDNNLPPDCLWNINAIFVNAMEKDYSIDKKSDASLLYSINAIADQYELADFKNRVKSLSSVWSKLYLKPRNPNNRYYSRSYHDNSSPISRVIEAIDFYSRLDEKQNVDKIIRKFDEEMFGRRAIVTLIENGFYSQARKLCKRMWSDPDQIDYSDRKYARYSKKLDSQLLNFVEQFGNESTKFLAETYFASLPDSKLKNVVAETTQNERLHDLASRYPGISFQSKEHDQITLLFLSKATELEGKTIDQRIAKSIQDYASKFRTIDLWEPDGNESFAHNRELYATWLLQELNDKRLDVIAKAISNLLKDKPKEDDWNFGRMIEEVTDKISNPLQKQLVNSTPAEIQQALPVLRQLSHPNLQNSRQLDSIAVTTHVVIDANDELKAWYDELKSELERTRGDYYDTSEEETELEPFKEIDLDDSWSFLASYVKDRSEYDARDARIALVKKMWKTAASYNIKMGTDHFQEGIKESCSSCKKRKMGLQAIEKSKLLTAEEIAEIAPELASSESVYGEIWRQIAWDQFEKENFDEAARAMKSSLDQTEEKMEQAKTNRTVEYAFMLSRLDRNDEAEKLLKSIDNKQLLGDNEKRYEELIEKFGK